MAAPAKPAARKARPSPQPARSDMRPVIWVALAIFLADQALKYVVVHMLDLDRVRSIDVFPPWLNLRMAWNQGVNFGLMSSGQDFMRWVLIGIAALALVLARKAVPGRRGPAALAVGALVVAFVSLLLNILLPDADEV